MKFLRDPAESADLIEAMRQDLEFQRYELGVAIWLAHDLGMTWEQLGEATGLTKSGAATMAKRAQKGRLIDIDDAELERIGRLIGVGDRVPRFEVRVIVSGKVGVSKVTRETLSVHLRREVAEEKARAKPGSELWELAPDGRRRRLHVRSREAVLRALEAAQEPVDF